jgi:hypothetical protein
MWWNDIREIKECLNKLTERILMIEACVKPVDGESKSFNREEFDDYMKNVDKLNTMINEFKGCVSMARGALEERKQLSEQEGKTAVLADITHEIYKAMLSFIRASEKMEEKAHFKINAIYRAICENEEEKPKKKKTTKKA